MDAAALKVGVSFVPLLNTASRGTIILAYEMLWYNNPKYLRRKEEFISIFKKWRLDEFTRLPKVIFICGASDSENRLELEKYYYNETPLRYLFFQAEKAWNVIKTEYDSINALEHEARLARYSDAILILVESYGSAAELGAFSLSEELRKKLLILLNKEFENDNSFINNGPVPWIDEDSVYKPVIQCNYNVILDSTEEIEKRLRRRLDQQKIADDIDYSYKDLLFFITQLITVLGPISVKHLQMYLNEILNFDDYQEISLMLSLTCALKLVKNFKSNFYNSNFYYCENFSLLKSIWREDTSKTLFRERSKMLNTLINIKDYNILLSELRKSHAS